MLALAARCLFDVFGGIAVAALAAAAGWHLFKLVRLPELGPWALLAALILFPGAARDSFVQMVILFLLIAAVAMLGEGSAWRQRHRIHRLLKRPGKSGKAGSGFRVRASR